MVDFARPGGVMALAASPFVATAGGGAPGPIDDFWYQPLGFGTATAAGVRVSEGTAYTLSAFWRGVHVVAGTLALLPLQVFERMDDDRRKLASRHPIYDLLHSGPNPRQTSIEWRMMMQASLMVRGNAYSLILPGPRGPVDQLWPLHPDRVQVRETRDRRLTYKVRAYDGSWEEIPEEWIFHIRGLSSDGITGMSVLSYARESFGEAFAAQQWGAKSFGQGMRPSGVLEYPGELSPEAERRFAESFQATYGGPNNAWKFMILEEGMKWTQMSLSPADAQFLGTRKFDIEEVSRWTGAPVHLLSHTEGRTPWGAGIESMNLGFLLYTELYWTTLWEQSLNKDLITSSSKFYAEHNLDALLRGDAKSRAEVNRIAISSGWRSPNEVRRQNNEDPIDGLDYYLRPLNMAVIKKAGDDPFPDVPTSVPLDQRGRQSPPVAPPPGPAGLLEGGAGASDLPSGGIAEGRLAVLARMAAERVINKETQALQKSARRSGADREVWTQAVRAFYADHAGYVSAQLAIRPEEAEAYCAEQQEALLFYGPRFMETWAPGKMVLLARLAAQQAAARETTDGI